MAPSNPYVIKQNHFSLHTSYMQPATLRHLNKHYGEIHPEYWLNVGEGMVPNTRYSLDVLGKEWLGRKPLPRMAAAKFYADQWQPARYAELNLLLYGDYNREYTTGPYAKTGCTYAALKKAAKTCSAVYTERSIYDPFVAYLVQWGLLVLHDKPWPQLARDNGCTENPMYRFSKLRQDRERWDSIQYMQRGYVRAMLGVDPVTLPVKLGGQGNQSELSKIQNGVKPRIDHLLRTEYSLGGGHGFR